MNAMATVLLDALGLLLLAAGAAALLWPLLGLGCLLVAGLVVLAGSAWASRPPRVAEKAPRRLRKAA